MKDINKILVNQNATIKEAMRVIDQGAIRTALVVDKNNKLCGIVTDGDIRSTMSDSTLYVYATPSLNALPGDYELKVSLISTSVASRTVINTLTVENCHGVALASAIDSEETCAGLPGQFSLTLTNEGSFSETFELRRVRVD